ncbi:Imm1 family immunity protein [Actinokineospora iranica]|uniref:Immunity protein Imm1 n=1 Tax=Actinokineospora iranica TaxID=1271860 RepID=A0A1G6T8L6_9PSEU|nr:Imm1 family immunity protein [Actinokineospora iranica]SDD25204.1 Immunity protein Imm1 [Actinokineospora iranica]
MTTPNGDLDPTEPIFYIEDFQKDLTPLITLMERSIAKQVAGDDDDGVLWWLEHPPLDRKMVFGVRRKWGIAIWVEHNRMFFPSGGANPEDVDYFTGDGDHYPQGPHTEVPATTAIQAVSEFTTTGTRPICVEWVEYKPR